MRGKSLREFSTLRKTEAALSKPARR